MVARSCASWQAAWPLSSNLLRLVLVVKPLNVGMSGLKSCLNMSHRRRDLQAARKARLLLAVAGAQFLDHSDARLRISGVGID